MMNNLDTICALATPNGAGAIGVIRVSGPSSFEFVSTLFSKNLTEFDSHTTHFGLMKSLEGKLVDEVLVTVFHAGKSFTGEESVEISCHGSRYILEQILTELGKVGVRMALPGEFTQRAFLNGKMDLSQAEAVADLIASQSKTAHEIALKQLRGNFSQELKLMREQLINFASLVELELDFSEEDVEFADRTQLKSLVDEVLHRVNRMAKSFELGNAIKMGVPVAIVGAPNTGKSTLLNALLGENRAIVSDIAGTTRDVIEETLNIDGILFRLIDTAGIRETSEEIEALGIERAKEKITQARVVLCLADASNELNKTEVEGWLTELRKQFTDKIILGVLNKTDRAEAVNEPDWIAISAKHGTNLDTLKKHLVDAVVGDFNLQDETIIVNARHQSALIKTFEALSNAQNGLETGITGDFIAMDIRQAMHWLGSITGDISEDDLLANIFSKFCIGK